MPSPNIGIGTEYTFNKYYLKPFGNTNFGYFDYSYIFDVSFGTYFGSKYQFGMGLIYQNYPVWELTGEMDFRGHRDYDYGILVAIKAHFFKRIPFTFCLHPMNGPSYKFMVGYQVF